MTLVLGYLENESKEGRSPSPLDFCGREDLVTLIFGFFVGKKKNY